MDARLEPVRRDTDLTLKVLVVLESPTGERVAELETEERFMDAMAESELPRLTNRVLGGVRRKALPDLRRQLRGWVEDRLPQRSLSFDDESARRCDATDEWLAAQDWMDPRPMTDEESEWMERLAQQVEATARSQEAR